MASLELMIDATGVTRGAADARRGLDSVIGRAGDAETAMGRLSERTTVTGASMRDAFGAGRGSLELLRGLGSAANAIDVATVGTRNLGQAAFAAAGAASLIGQTKDSWRNLSTAMESTTVVAKEVVRDQFGIAIGMKDVVQTQRRAVSGWSVLWSTLRANPLTAIATGLAVVGTALAAFSASTEKAKDKWEDFAESLGRVQARGQISGRVFGDSFDVNAAASDEFRRMAENLQLDILRGRAEQTTASAFGRKVNVDPETVLRTLLPLTTKDRASTIRAQGFLQDFEGNLGEYTEAPVFIDPNEQILLLQQLANYQRRQTYLRNAGRDFKGYGPALPPSMQSQRDAAAEEEARRAAEPYDGIGPYLPGSAENSIALAQANQWRSDQADKKREEDRRKSLEHMRELEQAAQRVAGALGSGIYDFLSGARDAKEIVGSLANDLGRAITQQAVSAGASALFSGFNSK